MKELIPMKSRNLILKRRSLAIRSFRQMSLFQLKREHLHHRPKDPLLTREQLPELEKLRSLNSGKRELRQFSRSHLVLLLLLTVQSTIEGDQLSRS